MKMTYGGRLAGKTWRRKQFKDYVVCRSCDAAFESAERLDEDGVCDRCRETEADTEEDRQAFLSSRALL